MKNGHNVLVYGTLKRGFYNHSFMKTSRFLGVASTVQSFVMFDGPYPRIARPKQFRAHDLQRVESVMAPVRGELFRVDDQTRDELDRLEGVPHLYTRERVKVTVPAAGAAEVGAWLYVMARTGGALGALSLVAPVNDQLEWKGPYHASHTVAASFG